MVDKPTNIPTGRPVLLDEATTMERVEPTLNYLNDSADFADAANAYREAQNPEGDGFRADFSTLDATGVIDVADDIRGLESPAVIRPFVDGGYHVVDTMTYSAASEVSERYNGGGTPGATDGFRYIDVARLGNQLPPVPVLLPIKARGIVHPDIAGGSNELLYTVAARTPNNFSGRQLQLSLWQTSARSPAGWYLINYGVYPPSRNYPGIRIGAGQRDGTGTQVPIDSVFVYEHNSRAYVDDQDLLQMDFSFSAGRYDSVEAAMSDPRPGGAFACLSPDHPNHIAALSGSGVLSSRAGDVRGSLLPWMRGGRYYYFEVLAGDPQNNLLNRAVALPTSGDISNDPDIIPGSG